MIKAFYLRFIKHNEYFINKYHVHKLITIKLLSMDRGAFKYLAVHNKNGDMLDHSDVLLCFIEVNILFLVWFLDSFKTQHPYDFDDYKKRLIQNNDIKEEDLNTSYFSDSIFKLPHKTK